jgi:hypothetical protein
MQALCAEADLQKGRLVRCLPFILKTDVASFVERISRGGFRTESLPRGEFQLLRIVRVPAEDSRLRDKVSGEFGLFRVASDIWCICSASDAKVFRACAVGALQYAAPRTSLIYVTTNEMRSMFDSWAGEAIHVKILRHSEYNRNESTINFLRRRKDYRVVFAEIAEKNSVLRSLAGLAQTGKATTILEFSLSNVGHVAFRRGSLTFLTDRLLLDVAKVGVSRHVMFSNRERSRHELRPLSLIFDAEVVGERAQNNEFVRALTSVEKSAVAVFHANPYIHLIFTDFRDGSSFHIYSTSRSAITIVPSFKASIAALMSLYRGISEKFADCVLSDSPTQVFGIEDFIPSATR